MVRGLPILRLLWLSLDHCSGEKALAGGCQFCAGVGQAGVSDRWLGDGGGQTEAGGGPAGLADDFHLEPVSSPYMSLKLEFYCMMKINHELQRNMEHIMFNYNIKG